MTIVKNTEKVINPLQESALNKKGLCDYVINVASGCLHGCSFCYVPSTPVIRARQNPLKSSGIADPQMDWGNYLLIREGIPEKLEKKLSRKRTWHSTPAGRGVVLLCSGTDPYQNLETAAITRQTIEILLRYNKRVRILTRSPLWLKDIDILSHPNVIVGMSLPHMDDKLSRQIEPNAPPPSIRYKALLEGHQAGCRIYVAIAPTPPQMRFPDFVAHLEKLMQLNPEVLFWEPINARGSNGKRMEKAGLSFANTVMDKQSWASSFAQQWHEIESAAEKVGCIHRLHIWADAELEGFVNLEVLQSWWYRPTVEKWSGVEAEQPVNAATLQQNSTQLPLLDR
ncbi:SPL family radical SAM protein [Leptolyngbya sp. AN03gr2]|uniref:SPL family radical SAM protein n=1 Tax=unclassified Leptolyngbya TaxID=2650499 RepID=UPI003D318F8A